MVSGMHMPGDTEEDGGIIAAMSTCTQCSAEATTRCVQCQARLCAEHAVRGHPLITARHLVATTVSTAVRAPGLLGDLLFKEMEQVDYCAACRQEVARRRELEQLKFAGGLLLLVLLIVGLPVFLLLS